MQSVSKDPIALYAPLPECHHMDSAHRILSGCQCPVIPNIVTERHNIASSMILKVVSGGFCGSKLVHTDVGSAWWGSLGGSFLATHAAERQA
eukprot:41458-Pelagomonas_calceolata.AAC.1